MDQRRLGMVNLNEEPAKHQNQHNHHGLGSVDKPSGYGKADDGCLGVDNI